MAEDEGSGKKPSAEKPVQVKISPDMSLVVKGITASAAPRAGNQKTTKD